MDLMLPTEYHDARVYVLSPKVTGRQAILRRTSMLNTWFFFSYAHADDGEYLREFYKHLNWEVSKLTGRRQKEIVFLDRATIAHGATWDAALEEGLRSCGVFVPVYSTSYFRSDYCGKEFAVFRQRLHDYQQQQGLQVDDTLILPVLWQPEQSILEELPTPINKIPYTHESYPAEYMTEGACSLVKFGTPLNSTYYNWYEILIRNLGRTIYKAADRLPLPPLTTPLPPLDSVTSLFQLQLSAPSSSDKPKNPFVESLYDLALPHKSHPSNKPFLINAAASSIDDSKVPANSATTSNPIGTSDVTKQEQLIFICYRREDSADISGRIYDRLAQQFGDKAIFKDVDSIPLGVDFKQYLEKQVERCNVLLAVIGKTWLKKRTGKRRLDDPRDFVRIEIASALRRDIRVIPLMVSNASMPSEADLPEDLRALVFRNYIQIRSDPDFHHDMNRLIKELERATLLD